MHKGSRFSKGFLKWKDLEKSYYACRATHSGGTPLCVTSSEYQALFRVENLPLCLLCMQKLLESSFVFQCTTPTMACVCHISLFFRHMHATRVVAQLQVPESLRNA